MALDTPSSFAPCWSKPFNVNVSSKMDRHLYIVEVSFSKILCKQF